MSTISKPIKNAFDAVEGLDLSGKVFLITGAYSGLGAATTEALLKAGASVIVAGRSEKLQLAFAQKLKTKAELNVSENRLDASHTLDLGDLDSVKKFALYVNQAYATIDCIINNAGVMNTPYCKTKDGFEMQMGVNVIGHYLLNRILVKKTKRQVWLSSAGHCLVGQWPGIHDLENAPRIDIEAISNAEEDTYDGWYRYQQSKLGDILLAKQFSIEFQQLKTCSVHPGIVRTNLSRHMSIWPILKHLFRLLMGKGGDKPVKTEQGARTQTLCAVMPDGELVNGAYYFDCKVSRESKAAQNQEDAKKLYDYCDKVTKAYQQ